MAQQLNGEIISADSRQVYRGMDIGTGKDLVEYQNIVYHLIDIVEAGESYHLYQYQQDFHSVLVDILGRGKTPILCGGSGLYIEAVLKGHQFTAVPVNEKRREALEKMTELEQLTLFKTFQTVFSEKADISTRKRLIRAIEISEYLIEKNLQTLPTYPALPNYTIYGLNPSVEIRRKRISKRLHERLNNGMIEEVKRLLDEGISAEKLLFYGLEYKFITEFLLAKMSYKTMIERLETAICQFAKRQMTFFRKMEKDGFKINWVEMMRE